MYTCVCVYLPPAFRLFLFTRKIYFVWGYADSNSKTKNFEQHRPTEKGEKKPTIRRADNVSRIYLRPDVCFQRFAVRRTILASLHDTHSVACSPSSTLYGRLSIVCACAFIRDRNTHCSFIISSWLTALLVNRICVPPSRILIIVRLCSSTQASADRTKCDPLA